LGKLGNGVVSQIVEPEPCESSFFSEIAPSPPPASNRACWIEDNKLCLENLVAVESGRRPEGRENVMQKLDGTEHLSPFANL
ncbi:MAG TPA: hypothetical protein VF747_13900, partial [Blastocatellia bacterium]